MLEVNPEKRIKWNDILKHRLFAAHSFKKMGGSSPSNSLIKMTFD